MPTIRQLRQTRGLTQLQVANHLGVVPSTVYHWERGTKLPNARHLQQMARLFGVSADDILLPEPGEQAGEKRRPE